MKKILFGGAAALLSIAGMSSFKAVKHFTTYRFVVTSDVTLASPGNHTSFTNNQVTPTSGSGPSCAGGSYYCIVTFTQGQLNTDHTQLIGSSQQGVTVSSRN